MNPKIEKLREEHEKNAEKIEKLTARNKVIDETVTRLENADIVGLVREEGLTPDMLAKLLVSIRQSPFPANTLKKEEESYESEETQV